MRFCYYEVCHRTSLVVQWLRIRLPMQGTWVQSRGTSIPHAMGQLSLCTTTTEPARSRALVLQLERSPHAATKDPACRNEDLMCRN